MNDLKKIIISPHRSVMFKSTFAQPVQQDVIMTNPTANVVAYKVKMTSPDLIVPRPGYGYIFPGKTASVTIMIRALNHEEEKPSKNQRLSILFATAPDDRPSNAYKFWQALDKSNIVLKKRKRIVLEFETVSVTEETED